MTLKMNFQTAASCGVCDPEKLDQWKEQQKLSKEEQTGICL
jgi:hypothetical protein